VSRRRLRLGAAGTAALFALAVLVPATAGAKTTITASGSTTVAPLFSLLAKKYVKKTDGKVAFRLLQGGSDVGVADVAAGRVDIGNSSRDPKEGDPGGLVFNKVALDALCVATNNSNPISNMDTDTVRAVYGGDVREWGSVPGSGTGGTIDLFVRTPASGTQDAFDKIFMSGKSVFSGAKAEASNGLVQQRIKDTPTGTGYVSLFFTDGINPVAYNGVACDLRNAKSGEYGGLRNLWMVTRGDAGGKVGKFIKWAQNSSKAAKITGTAWVPLN
jgi:phosphate transport system substrate-binding protein